MQYQVAFAHSISQTPNERDDFWSPIANQLHWYSPPKTTFFQGEHGVGHWFVDGQLNTCYLALDYHIAQGRGDKTALIYDSPVSNQVKKFSYLELKASVEKIAGALTALGVRKGDRVLIYMPMTPEGVMGMLACARIGAIHSVVFGGFAPPELAARIDDAKPTVILSASCGIEGKNVIAYKPLLDKAIDLASHKPTYCLIFQRSQLCASLIEGRDLDWQTTIANSPAADCVPVSSTDPLYILYTSGTTGTPKGVVRENGSHAVALNYSMQAIYGLKQDEVFWAASDIGWVVGHSYIVYGPLIYGATTILYEGKPVGTPDAGAFWRICQEYQVSILFAAPTAFRAIRKEDPDANYLKRYDLSKLRSIFSAGERLDPPTQEWLMQISGKPVIDHWWQTETGWAITSNPQGFSDQVPIKLGSSTFPTCGFDVQILNDAGNVVPRGTPGYIAIKLPLPPGCLTTIWGNPERFRNGYLAQFPGYYASGDGGVIDEDGYVFVMGRVDDTINVAGHRLSTGEIEQVLGGHASVAECAVVAKNDDLKGQVPVGLVVLKSGVDIDVATIRQDLQREVRDQVGAFACYKETFVVKRLPKTRSGKILRRNIRQIVNGEPYQVPSTVDDPSSLPELAEQFAEKFIRTTE